MKIHATLTNGVLDYDTHLALQLLKEMENGKYEISVNKWKSTRSLNQNRYYWKVVIGTLAEHTKQTPQMMHSILGFMFLKQEVPEDAKTLCEYLELDGFNRIKSTTELGTKDFETFMEECRRWGATISCNILEPNETSFAY